MYFPAIPLLRTIYEHVTRAAEAAEKGPLWAYFSGFAAVGSDTIALGSSTSASRDTGGPSTAGSLKRTDAICPPVNVGRGLGCGGCRNLGTGSILFPFCGPRGDVDSRVQNTSTLAIMAMKSKTNFPNYTQKG